MKLLSRKVTAPLPAVTAWPVTSISLAPLQNFLGRRMCRYVTEPSLSVLAPIAVIRLMTCTSVTISSPPVSSPSCRFSCASSPWSMSVAVGFLAARSGVRVVAHRQRLLVAVVPRWMIMRPSSGVVSDAGHNPL